MDSAPLDLTIDAPLDLSVRSQTTDQSVESQTTPVSSESPHATSVPEPIMISVTFTLRQYKVDTAMRWKFALNNYRFSDIKIMVPPLKLLIYGHKLVLGQRSGLFNRIFTLDESKTKKFLVMEHFDTSAINLLKLMYSGAVTVSSMHEIYNLMVLATKWDVRLECLDFYTDDLQRQIEQTLAEMGTWAHQEFLLSYMEMKAYFQKKKPKTTRMVRDLPTSAGNATQEPARTADIEMRDRASDQLQAAENSSEPQPSTSSAGSSQDQRPQTLKRKRANHYKSYSPEQLAAALEQIEKGNKSVTQAAAEYRVPTRTLHDYRKNPHKIEKLLMKIRTSDQPADTPMEEEDTDSEDQEPVPAKTDSSST